MQKIIVEEMTKFSHIDILIGRVLYEFLETTNDKGISCISKIKSTVNRSELHCSFKSSGNL